LPITATELDAIAGRSMDSRSETECYGSLRIERIAVVG
jgi:hypothetical protein